MLLVVLLVKNNSKLLFRIVVLLCYYRAIIKYHRGSRKTSKPVHRSSCNFLTGSQPAKYTQSQTACSPLFLSSTISFATMILRDYYNEVESQILKEDRWYSILPQATFTTSQYIVLILNSVSERITSTARDRTSSGGITAIVTTRDFVTIYQHSCAWSWN